MTAPTRTVDPVDVRTWPVGPNGAGKVASMLADELTQILDRFAEQRVALCRDYADWFGVESRLIVGALAERLHRMADGLEERWASAPADGGGR